MKVLLLNIWCSTHVHYFQLRFDNNFHGTCHCNTHIQKSHLLILNTCNTSITSRYKPQRYKLYKHKHNRKRPMTTAIGYIRYDASITSLKAFLIHLCSTAVWTGLDGLDTLTRTTVVPVCCQLLID